MRNVDVASYYPSMILGFGFYPKRLTTRFLDVYGAIYTTRLKAKAAASALKKEKGPEYERQETIQQGLKITLNGSFGKLGSKYSKLYSPDLLLQVTITGQLMLLMLIEELEAAGMSVKSANTDGVEVLVADEDDELLKRIVFDWELRTGMVMEFGQYNALYARDVNNYVAVYPDEVKAKGVYTKPSLQKNSEYPIVFEAIRHYLLDGTPLYTTLRACKDIRKFLTARTVKGGGVWSQPLCNTVEYDRYIADANEEFGGFGSGRAGKDKGIETRNLEYRKLQMNELGKYLGKVVRWYYAKDGATIHYASNGNKVPKSDGAYPMMDLTDGIPDNLDYEKYLELAHKHLADLGVKDVD